MRSARLKLEGEGIYHCMSRTVNGAALFERREKEILRKMLHQVADFSGVEVLTYCLMNNHFHVLLRVPPPSPVSDAELLRRYAALYPRPAPHQPASIEVLRRELASNTADAVKLRERLLARMGDVSAFMKTLKQRFSTWFNRNHDRFGPLWSDRFKSVLVEGGGYALPTVAAYIDLNPVRAGVVSDPKDYRFCGYAEAVAGMAPTNRSLGFVVFGGARANVPTSEILAEYRKLLFGAGATPKDGGAAIGPQSAARVLGKEAGGLPAATLLRCRMRYFTEGAILGSREFVRTHAKSWQHRSGRKHAPKIRCVANFHRGVLTAVKGVQTAAPP